MSLVPGPASSFVPTVTRADLLTMKVSAILESHAGSLAVLVEHGFAPLKQPHLRAVLAHTVTLAQALRIRSLADDEERVLLDELVALFASTVSRQGAPSEAAN
ncbi:MAG TPA: DUF1858 domain-containing protein [Trueperaceae bacterium]|nr:DUF1858 domain-containing protein [Trueperaceae bacterium]